MLQSRIIPCLQLVGESLVKAVKFDKFNYIGDPINTVRIFNELEVDELCFLDIRATIENRTPNIEILKNIANECFMPLSYGGGVTNIDTALQILSIGFEKIVFNSVCYTNPSVVAQLANHSGVQSVIASVDVKKTLFGGYQVYSHSGKTKQNKNLMDWVQELEQLGVGEILLTAMDKEATWSGFDLELIKKITDKVSIPVVANAGAGSVQHIKQAIAAGASAVALGSMVVYQQKGMGVLVNFPDKEQLKDI